MPIPTLENNGLLPPYVGDPTLSQNHSPYKTTTLEIAQRFCATPARRELFRGLLGYRAELAALGIVNGFQWINGSFTADIEAMEGRDPRDIDILTFYHRPIAARDDIAWTMLVRANTQTFDPRELKQRFHCHVVHAVDLGGPGERTVIVTSFFNSLFSHQRLTKRWKGMLRVELNPALDAAAAAHIAGAP